MERSPSVTLIWMYQGKNALARRKQIEQFDYPNFNIVEVGAGAAWGAALRAIPSETDVCVFWIDDDKPVVKSFLNQMTKPLAARDDFRAVMHFWSGNAISVSKEMLDASGIEETGGVHSLLKLLLPVLEVSEKGPNGRVHLAFSSTEKLAPLSMEPVGFPS